MAVPEVVVELPNTDAVSLSTKYIVSPFPVPVTVAEKITCSPTVMLVGLEPLAVNEVMLDALAVVDMFAQRVAPLEVTLVPQDVKFKGPNCSSDAMVSRSLSPA